MAQHQYHLLAIDPGLAGTGWAYWNENVSSPSSVGVIGPPPTDWPIPDRCFTICSKLPVSARHLADLIIVCEYPEYQESTGRNMGWKTGDLQKLTFLAGYMAGYFRGIPFVPVKPSTWKGQLPKAVVTQRITDQLGAEWAKRSGVKTHAWDAVGIGLWFRDLKETT